MWPIDVFGFLVVRLSIAPCMGLLTRRIPFDLNPIRLYCNFALTIVIIALTRGDPLFVLVSLVEHILHQ